MIQRSVLGSDILSLVAGEAGISCGFFQGGILPNSDIIKKENKVIRSYPYSTNTYLRYFQGGIAKYNNILLWSEWWLRNFEHFSENWPNTFCTFVFALIFLALIIPIIQKLIRITMKTMKTFHLTDFDQIFHFWYAICFW